jgi:putative membrane protein
MVREGYWTWPGGGRYEDVPASNFAGWFVTAGAAFAIWALVDPDEPAPEDDGALALYAWTWAGETIANAVIWRRPVVAGAGCTAMGAVLAPALRRRATGPGAGPGRIGGVGR